MSILHDEVSSTAMGGLDEIFSLASRHSKIIEKSTIQYAYSKVLTKLTYRVLVGASKNFVCGREVQYLLKALT